MKKRGVFVFLALLLAITILGFASSHILTKKVTGGVTGSTVDGEDELKMGAEETKEKVNENLAGFQEGTNKALEQNVSLPPILKEISRVALGLESGESINLQKFVVLLCLFIILFLVIKQILIFVPFFEQNWMQWTGAFVIALISGISGGLQGAYYLFFSFADFIEPLRKSKLLQLVVALIILVVFFFGFTKLTMMLRNKRDIERAGEQGRKLARGVKSAEVFNKGVEDLAKGK